jgi:hypothetical protein
MTNLIDKRIQLKILKKNNKFMYKFYILHLKSGKYLLPLFLFLILYFAFRYFNLKCKDQEEKLENSAPVKYKKNYNSYTIKDNSKLSENNYLEKYRTMRQTKVTPIPNKVIKYM